MRIYCMPVGPIQANCYLVMPEEGKVCAVVDPGGDPDRILEQCDELGVTPQAVLLTHGHFDHTGGVAGLREKYPDLPVWFHRADASDTPGDQLGWYPVPGVKFYDEGDTVETAGLTFTVLHTPGHSPGSVVLRCEDCLFTGDTLFRGSMGRTDFPGGSYPQIMASLKRLADLPGDFRVLPGHEEITTLGYERRTNYYMAEAMK